MSGGLIVNDAPNGNEIVNSSKIIDSVDHVVD
jgi:hypothetical protein